MQNSAAPPANLRGSLFWYVIKYLLAGLLLGPVLGASAQTGNDKEAVLPVGAAAALLRHSERLDRNLLQSGTGALRDGEKLERKIWKKLLRKDTSKAAAMLRELPGHYAALSARLREGEGKAARFQGKYVPTLDSLQAALSLLQTGPSATAALKKIQALQGRVDRHEEVGKLLEERTLLLKDLLNKYHMPKELRKLREQESAYRQQLQHYTRLLQDPSGVEAHVLRLVTRVPLFQSFFRAHSQLAALLPAGNVAGGAATVPAGIQSREAVMESLVKRKGSAGQVQEALKQQVSAVPSMKGLLHTYLPDGEAGRGNEVSGSPDIGQRDRHIGSRLVYGISLQTVKRNRFLPASTDIGFSVGYRVRSKIIAGIGASYSLGWGDDLRHLRVSSEGPGFRTFGDYRINSKFWLSAGGDLHYKTRLRNMEPLQGLGTWQKSAWMGISKTCRVSSRYRGRMQLVYDVLWKQQVPASQPFLFRLGYQLR